MQNEYIVPLATRSAPARKGRLDLIEKHYEGYIQKMKLAIKRPESDESHKDIKYLESMILYLTQECKQTLKTLIRCDYLSENWHLHMIADWHKQVDKQEEQMLAIKDDKPTNQRRKASTIQGAN